MKYSVLLLVFIVFLPGCTQPSSTKPPAPKTAADSTEIVQDVVASHAPYLGPRYLLLQSTIAAKGTYKLDSYTGTVYQMQEDRRKNVHWIKIKRQPNLLYNDSTADGRPNYQLFLSTIAMRFTYLININTGATWELVEDPQTTEDFFSPIFDN